ncbi:phage fiber-tail adaptor protein [Brevundimonas sp. Root1279]|uniref:phage fiber-tail adaptor protein n=1 Tax=Brevundimonas sp. Root1279 TaxID=1736443 RepID=UPI0006FA5E13|nr:hypothetical protein [Brevundimonas sp. Root1279]KQW79699.1 hypothetical protein ASC65_14215 [Brevundimonas sp. Root1279]
MILSWPAKFGDEVLDYEIDWTAALDGDTVTTVTASPVGGIVIDEEDTVGALTTLRISGGGTRATTTRVNLLADTAAGRKIGAQVKLPILGR